MTATPCSVKSVTSVKSESLNGSWIEIQENNESPFHFIKNGRESKNSSFEKIMIGVQNELIQLSMSSNSSCKEQLQQINQKLSSRASESPPLQVDGQQFELDQLEKFDDEQFQNLKSDLLWYWQQDDCKNFFDEKKTDQLNLRQWMVRRGIFNKEVLSLLVLSNVVSVVLGVGIGYTALIRSFRG